MDATMKVGELIDLLSDLDREAEVYTEGCDCDGEACSVGAMSDGSIIIRRSLVGAVPPRFEQERARAMAEAEEREAERARARAEAVDPFGPPPKAPI